MTMKKLMVYLIFALLVSNPCFSQIENNDTLSIKIEGIKEVYRTIGLSNLDKVEGIYFFKRVGGMKDWEGETTKLFNQTTTKTVCGFILRNLEVANRFDIYEYYEGRNYFAMNNNKWFIKKDGDKYIMTCCSENSGKDFDHFENEIVFLENNISFTQDSKYKLANGGSSYNFESIKKIYPSTLEDNIFKTGTGFFISQNGYIITNNHVVENANNIYVSNQIYTRLKAEVIFVDKFNDIALLKVNLSIKNIPYNIFNGDKEIGNNVFTLGYPFVQSMGKEVKLTNGIINSNSGFENDTRYYQFSAEIQPGNSGGPLFDSDGNIVGLVSAKDNKATNAGYALKSKFVVDFIKLNDPSILKKNISTFKNLNLTSKYKILKDYVLLLEIE